MIPPVICDLPGGRLGCTTCGEIFARDWRHYHVSIAGGPRVIITHPPACDCRICNVIPCERREELRP